MSVLEAFAAYQDGGDVRVPVSNSDIRFGDSMAWGGGTLQLDFFVCSCGCRPGGVATDHLRNSSVGIVSPFPAVPSWGSRRVGSCVWCDGLVCGCGFLLWRRAPPTFEGAKGPGLLEADLVNGQDPWAQGSQVRGG